MAYRDFKYLPKRKASYKLLCDKAFDIAKNPKYDGYKQGFTSNIFDKKLQVVHLLKVKMQ